MILLDTHTLIWFLTSPDKLSSHARITIEKELKYAKLQISSITIWEICQLVKREKVKFKESLSKTLQIINKMNELEFIAIDNQIAQLSESLPGIFHKDPADRFIVATAIQFGATLITKDEKIRKYKHIQTLW